MLSFALAAKPGVKGFASTRMKCDQDMFQRYAMQNPHNVTLDVDEQVFGNLNRHFRALADDEEGKAPFTCLQDGRAKKCQRDPSESTFQCTQDADGMRVIRDDNVTVAPFVIHVSGNAAMWVSKTCYTLFKDSFGF